MSEDVAPPTKAQPRQRLNASSLTPSPSSENVISSSSEQNQEEQEKEENKTADRKFYGGDKTYRFQSMSYEQKVPLNVAVDANEGWKKSCLCPFNGYMFDYQLL
ncbi:hypothetical protein AVEN_161827-1 [Araneus ventricosus]|uniref:Uncharacterized protein n=1 Tax=Araneus ventricosus TaxID=182803 RepID=A0A4Y2B4K0_ARAVE|nr:hypothetical protein AVEN_141261-1 [Araneus ventricosus]GBL86216.1 hypothetical protein AVEN_161827-1 [Araneus ventricosus]